MAGVKDNEVKKVIGDVPMCGDGNEFFKRMKPDWMCVGWDEVNETRARMDGDMGVKEADSGWPLSNV